MPAQGKDWAYLSSGTWSLIGVELASPLINDNARSYNFTNEAGYGGTTRFLKNISGMWLLQESRREWIRRGEVTSYDEIDRQVEQSEPFRSLIDPNAELFMTPGSMPEKIAEFCRQTGQPEPKSVGQVARCIFESLALSYRQMLDRLEKVTGSPIARLHTDSAGLEIDGQPFIQRWPAGQENVVSKVIELEAGRTYRLSLALQAGKSGHVHLGWIPPGANREPEKCSELLTAVREADAVLFIGGLNHQYDVEGSDRQDMALHDGQNELLSQVLGLNPRTVVVIIGGSPVEMPWVANAPGIVQAWYGGMEGGNALADVLLGDVNPSGKLPMTLPRSIQDTPAHRLDDYAGDFCNYKEGIFVGYRWYDAQEIAPLFPFGHGLSYTSFALANMRLEKFGNGLRIGLDITNTGHRTGSEVIQIYVGQPNCSVERPVRELKEFTKVTLQPSETRHIEVSLPREAFAFWSLETNAWTVEAGEFVIEAGVSSRHICCKGNIRLG